VTLTLLLYNYFQSDSKWYIWRAAVNSESLIEQKLAVSGEGITEGPTIPIWHHAKFVVDENNHAFKSLICDDTTVPVDGRPEYLRLSAAPAPYPSFKHFRSYFIVRSGGAALDFYIANLVITHSEPEC